MAKSSGVTIAPHGCQELQLPLAAGIAHGEFLEYYPTEVDPLRRPRCSSQSSSRTTTATSRCPTALASSFELNMDLLDRFRVA